MIPFHLGLLTGALLASLLWIVVPFFIREIRIDQRRRRLTEQHREDTRFVRAVAGSVRTPLPGRKVA